MFSDEWLNNECLALNQLTFNQTGYRRISVLTVLMTGHRHDMHTLNLTLARPRVTTHARPRAQDLRTTNKNLRNTTERSRVPLVSLVASYASETVLKVFRCDTTTTTATKQLRSRNCSKELRTARTQTRTHKRNRMLNKP